MVAALLVTRTPEEEPGFLATLAIAYDPQGRGTG